MKQPDSYLALVLHAHLPFVRHPEYNDPMEEYWLVGFDMTDTRLDKIEFGLYSSEKKIKKTTGIY